MRHVVVSCSASGPADEEGMTYKGAVVDIDAGTELVCRIRKLAPGIGFGSLYPHVSKSDINFSKSAFVSSATALEKWVELAGLTGKLKGF